MTTTKTIEEINRELGEQVLEDARHNPRKYLGRYVGIANGKVIVVTDDLNELALRLKEVEPDLARTYGVDIRYDYSKPYHIREFW